MLRETFQKKQQGMEVKVERNADESSGTHCCCRRAMSITYSECVNAALLIHHAKGMRRIIRPSPALSGSSIFSYIIS